MIVLKTSRELALMREACRISAGALQVAGEAVRPGISTWEIDKIAYDYIKRSQQPFALMCSEISSWNVNVIATNDTLNPIKGKFRVKDIETGNLLLEGEFNTTTRIFTETK